MSFGSFELACATFCAKAHVGLPELAMEPDAIVAMNLTWHGVEVEVTHRVADALGHACARFEMGPVGELARPAAEVMRELLDANLAAHLANAPVFGCHRDCGIAVMQVTFPLADVDLHVLIRESVELVLRWRATGSLWPLEGTTQSGSSRSCGAAQQTGFA